MKTFHLADEHVDANLERGLLAALNKEPTLYWELIDLLPSGAFDAESETWQEVSEAIEGDRPCNIPEGWEPAEDPKAAAHRLADLYQRRRLANLQEELAAGLADLQIPAQSLTETLQANVESIQSASRELRSGALLWASDLSPDVLRMAAERRKLREKTGKAVTGISTGLPWLDKVLNGLNPGLYVLGGGPGVGKSTLALQISVQAAGEGIPVLYISYENSPKNLVLKALCADAHIPATDVERGFGDEFKLQNAFTRLRPAFGKLGLIEGTSKLGISHVKARALQMLNRHGAKSCLIVFDYLQRAAHTKGYEQLRHNVSALTGELRELSMRLDSPILALASQNRVGGNYGNSSKGGSANLDSLKESGDLEYSADVVLFLTKDEKRFAQPPARAIDLTVAKNRFGELGQVPLIFRADLGIFTQEESRHD